MKQTKNPHKRPHNVTFSNVYKNYLTMACNPQGGKVVIEFDTWNDATTAQINWRKYLRYCEWLAHEEGDEALLAQTKQAAPWYWALKDEHGQTSPPRGEDRRKPCKVTGTFGPKEMSNLEDKMLKGLMAANPAVFNMQDIGRPIVTNPHAEHLARRHKDAPEESYEDIIKGFDDDDPKEREEREEPDLSIDRRQEPHTRVAPHADLPPAAGLGANPYQQGDELMGDYYAQARQRAIEEGRFEEPTAKRDTSLDIAMGLDPEEEERKWQEGEARKNERIAQAKKEGE